MARNLLCTVPRNPKLKTLSVSLPAEMVERLRHLKFHHDLSGSGIIEQALLRFIEDASDLELAERLRSLGARRRRSPDG